MLISDWISDVCSSDLGEIIDHVFPRGQVDLESFALLVRQVGEPAVEHGFCRRDQLDDHSVTIGNRRIDCGQQDGELHRQKQLREEALLRSLEYRQRCRLGTGVERRPGLGVDDPRSEEHTSELKSLMRISYAVFWLK